MKYIVFALLLASTVQADILNKCLVVHSGATTTTGFSTIKPLPPLDPKAKDARAFTGVLVAENTGGTNPTLDVTIQSCKDMTEASCVNTPITFTQCTTGTCRQYIDLNKSMVNLFPFFRTSHTVGGTSSPSYNVSAEICYP